MAKSAVRLEENFRGRADDFYEALIRAHQGLSDAESHTLNARLVLILANHIGDLEALEEAIALARGSIEPTEPDAPAQAR
ncbi:MAG TPA: DUF2783 domain-containing protein [Geminicoccaceae bacterium]|jgi:hypothetical protein|nr:DUF2783 domain-containing protein [Geminicoccaceae bacterium]